MRIQPLQGIRTYDSGGPTVTTDMIIAKINELVEAVNELRSES